MSSLHPYRGWLVSPTAADRVVAPAYDSLSAAERGAVAAAEPDSFLNVMRSPEDQPPGGARDREELLAASRATLDRLLADGAFDRHDRPTYQFLRMRRGDHVQTGVVGTVPVADIGADVRLHEETREDKEDDLVRHLEVVGVESSPVGLVHPGPSPVADLMSHVTAQPPDLTVTSDDGLEQEVWTVAGEDDVTGVARAFRDVPALYLTDGHHRAASAVRHAARSASRRSDDPARRLLVVVFPASELRLEPYHRVVHGIGADRTEDVLAAIAERFTVTASAGDGLPDPPAEAGTYAMHLAGRWYDIRSTPDAPAVDPVAALDVSILHERILGPVLDVGDARTDDRLDFVPGTRGLAELVRRAGEDGAAFALAPTDVRELMAVADAGAVMPPKSTWFEPKLRSGMFLYGVGPDWHAEDAVG